MEKVKLEIITIDTINIIKRSFFGNIIVDDVIDSFELILSQYLTDNHKISGIINDLRDAQLVFKMIEFRSLLSYIKRNENIAKLPIAGVTDSPISIIFPTIASKFMGIKVKPFNDMDEAMNWILQMAKSKTVE